MTRPHPVPLVLATLLALVAGLAGMRLAEASAVVGGRPTSVQAWPWMTQLESPNREGGRTTFCGATLVAPNAVLTAEHCLAGLDERTRAVLGRHAFDWGAVAYRRIAGVSVPKQGLHGDFVDLALLWLARPVTSVTPILLGDPAAPPPVPATHAVVLGWGITATGRQPSSGLQAGDEVIRSISTCLHSYANRFGVPQIDEALDICARPVKPGGACNGDSGGPLVIGDAIAGWRQMGVVSWGDNEDRCRRSQPTIYMRVDRGDGREWLDEALARGRPTLSLRRVLTILRDDGD
jgi:secreted trypsin-like serine protease